MAKKVKQPATINQHVDLLRSRGMKVDDDLAHQWLTYISYYRLSAYWYPARQMSEDGTLLDKFLDGTKFTDVVALYEADRKLRSLVHDGMGLIEIALRTRLGEVLCSKDALAYSDPLRFRRTFDHKKWMNTAQKRVKRAGRRNEAIQHYKINYGGKYPFWVLAEVLDFADISLLFEGLPVADQRSVAEAMGVLIELSSLSKNQQKRLKKQSPLVRWMEQLTVVRNFCAHHARLWNKSFTPASTVALRTVAGFEALPEGQSERIFGSLVVMSGLMRVISPGTTWPDKVTRLIENDFLSNPLVRKKSLGIPDSLTFCL